MDTPPHTAARSIVFEWNPDEFAEYLDSCAHDETVHLALQHLPRNGPILEAGCGLGQVVEYFHRRGYDIEGVEINPAVVGEIRRRHPHLRVAVGDVCALPCADNTYRGLLSFGVVEHFREGPAAPLREHLRVLSPGGIAIISVPSFNVLRRLKEILRLCLRPFLPRNFPPWKPPHPPPNRRGRGGLLYHTMPRRGPFFEYWFKPREFEREMTAAGFEILASLPTHHATGLWSDLGPRWAANENRRFVFTPAGAAFHRLFRRWPFFHNFMHTIVARKPPAPDGGIPA